MTDQQAYVLPLAETASAARTDCSSIVIKTAHEHEGKAGLYGQAPSDHPEFARFLVAAGIDSISVNPDSFVSVKQQVTQAERGGGQALPTVATIQRNATHQGFQCLIQVQPRCIRTEQYGGKML